MSAELISELNSTEEIAREQSWTIKDQYRKRRDLSRHHMINLQMQFLNMIWSEDRSERNAIQRMIQKLRLELKHLSLVKHLTKEFSVSQDEFLIDQVRTTELIDQQRILSLKRILQSLSFTTFVVKNIKKSKELSKMLHSFTNVICFIDTQAKDFFLSVIDQNAKMHQDTTMITNQFETYVLEIEKVNEKWQYTDKDQWISFVRRSTIRETSIKCNNILNKIVFDTQVQSMIIDISLSFVREAMNINEHHVSHKYDEQIEKSSAHKKEKEFNREYLDFLTKRRSCNYRWEMLKKESEEVNLFRQWVKNFSQMIEEITDIKTRKIMTKTLLTIWKDTFVTNVCNMLSTDLVEHRISTYLKMQSQQAKLSLYTSKEMKWQRENFSTLKTAEIITRCHSLWVTKIKFYRKSKNISSKLRMIYTFNLINDAIIKSNHFMQRMKSILIEVLKHHLKIWFQTNAFNEYYAVHMFLSHVYKIEFISTIEQYCYLRMSQELIDDSETYTRLKNIITEEIFFSNIESSLNMISESIIFAHFMNNNYEEAIIFEELVMFLHRHYFLQLA